MADKYIISKSKMTAIADAVRTKTGETGTLTADQIVTAIAGITSTDETAEWCKKAVTNGLSGDITVPDDITMLPSFLFSYDVSGGVYGNGNNITGVNCNNLSVVPYGFAKGRSNITSLTLSAATFEIGGQAFENTGITSLYVPYSDTTIVLAQSAFEGCKMSSVDINAPANVQARVFVNKSDTSASSSNYFIFRKTSSFEYGVFQGCYSNIVLYSDCSADADSFDGFNGKIYVKRADLSTYKAKTNFSKYASIIYPMPKYITYTMEATDAQIIVNSDDGTFTSSPLTSTYDSTTLTVISPSYDIKTISLDLSNTAYFSTYDLGEITLTQTNPIVTFTIPDGATLSLTYGGATFHQTETSATYRLKTGTNISYVLKLDGYRKYTATATTTGEQTIKITEDMLTKVQTVKVDITTPDASDIHLSNLVDGSNFEISDGKIRNGSASYHVDSGSSFGYIKIDTPKGGTTFSLTYTISSEESWDFGYIVLSEEIPSAYMSESALRDATVDTSTSYYGVSSGLILAGRYSGEKTGTRSFTLDGGKTYYVGIGYIKDGSADNNDDRIYITEIKYDTTE